jgi:hypothetical protein
MTDWFSDDRRGQAFTLEGLVSTAIILTAVLFALQSVIITPTTGGTVDPEVRNQLQREASDVLVTLGRNDTFGLEDMVRYWDQNRRTWYGGVNPDIGYGLTKPPNNVGELLNQTFAERGRTYNMIIRYRAKNETRRAEETRVVYRGKPSDSAVTASYTVTLYDNQTLTAPNSTRVELHQFDTNATDDDDGYYPIPNAVRGPVYNVVEVRLIVW